MSYHDRRDTEVNDYLDVIKYRIKKLSVIPWKKMKHSEFYS